MKRIATTFFLLLALLNLLSAQPREASHLQKHVALPDIPGYKTLKCDFHMHTTFSDGVVWPIFRVDEAIRDGLDVISLTEHTDFERFPQDIKRDINRSFDIATAYAKGKDLVIIKGAEISPRVPPYHNNALFLKDMNLPYNYMKVSKTDFKMKADFTRAQLMEPFTAAAKQGAFIFYNHPGNMPAWTVRDTAVFTSFHKTLLEQKMLSGIEVVNSGLYNVTAHRLAMKYNLTMLCNTDEHGDLFPRYSNTHRPMTLVFAKDRSEAAIKEALIARRTALYFDDYIIARQAEAEAFFKASVEAKVSRGLRRDEPALTLSLTNNSDVPFNIQLTSKYVLDDYPMGQLVIPAHKEVKLMFRAMWTYPEVAEFKIAVRNILVTPDAHLETVYNLKTQP